MARSGSAPIILTPSRMNSSPKPMISPSTTGRLVILAIQLTAPVSPMTNQKRPLNNPDTQIAPTDSAPAWLIAAVPMAFIG